MPKSKKRRHSPVNISRKIKKYENKLRELRNACDAGDASLHGTPSLPPSPASSSVTHKTLEDPALIMDENIVDVEGALEPLSGNENTIEVNELDEDILNLLGDAPQDTQYGPAIQKDLAIRWAEIIKSGLSKEKRTDLKNKYLTPLNCKVLDAPKLNLEAQAASLEMAVKRDKAIAAKQSIIGCALTALAKAFGIMCKDKENLTAIQCISDAGRMLCDHHHQESVTRKNFILQGLDQSIRESVKETKVDEWLFGEQFSEKLKASKAIKKSGQEISVNKPKKPLLNHTKNLNFKGPANNLPKSRTYRPGPQQIPQPYKRQAQGVHQKYAQPNKAPPRPPQRSAFNRRP